MKKSPPGEALPGLQAGNWGIFNGHDKDARLVPVPELCAGVRYSPGAQRTCRQYSPLF